MDPGKIKTGTEECFEFVSRVREGALERLARLDFTSEDPLLDTGYWSFPGVPKLGRLTMIQVRYDLFWVDQGLRAGSVRSCSKRNQKFCWRVMKRSLFRSGSVSEVSAKSNVTLRCPFCLTLNTVDLGKSGDRPTCGDCKKPLLLDRPVKVGGEDFDRTVLGSEAPVLVDFYADWCAPCKYVAPLMDELAQTHEGTLLVVKVDTDQAPDVSQQFEIRSIPTVILFKSGAEVGRSVGFEPEKLRAMAEEAVRPG